ncbi:hypothetical protein T459_28961 [Capsicum annuum]|uniref:Uncharacterized protein n=1 Tax=Capsicum annuum TaxID=4072 RepID=A0A2G2YIA1_CAPAN|nr:hypothetical protein T459_28961 [Capsicum annuum]
MLKENGLDPMILALLQRSSLDADREHHDSNPPVTDSSDVEDVLPNHISFSEELRLQGLGKCLQRCKKTPIPPLAGPTPGAIPSMSLQVTGRPVVGMYSMPQEPPIPHDFQRNLSMSNNHMPGSGGPNLPLSSSYNQVNADSSGSQYHTQINDHRFPSGVQSWMPISNHNVNSATTMQKTRELEAPLVVPFSLGQRADASTDWREFTSPEGRKCVTYIFSWPLSNYSSTVDGSLGLAHGAKSSPIAMSPSANLPTIVASESSSLSSKVSSPMIEIVKIKNSSEPALPAVANSEKIGTAVNLGNSVAPPNVKKDAAITEIGGATPSDEKTVELGPLVYESKSIKDFAAYLAFSSNTLESIAKDLFTDVMDELEKQVK